MFGKIIDTHVHVWNLDKASYSWLQHSDPILNRTYHIEELERERIGAGITEGVLVQSANNLEDTDWMLAVAAQTAWIRGVVGWLPLPDPTATARLLADKYSRNLYFKGIRHLIHNEPDPAWLLQERVLESLRIVASYGLSYDLVGTTPAHIQTALALAREVPGLRMVFDHLNQPPMAGGERFGRWGALMREAAGHPRFYIKISGLGTASRQGPHWSAATIEPYVAFALEQFGAGRCMCGSDWPVGLQAGSYAHTWEVYKEVINGLLKPQELEKVLWGNALDFYCLEP